MNSDTPSETETKRSYRQGARAEAAARTGEAILACFGEFLEQDWYDDISLEKVAKCAGVTVPTILRHFGSKEGMLQGFAQRFEIGVLERRKARPGDIDGTIAGVIADYEESGDTVMRFLAQEPRIAAIKTLNDLGRAHHRQWINASFAPFLDRLTPDEAEWRLDGLVVALDVYVWQLLRRDRGRTADDVRAFMRSLVDGILGPDLRTD
jgi:AcrR family transcriptional regulator